MVVYTSNDSNLNRFVFEAFRKETGIEVEQVEAGSGVVFRRMHSEQERPLGDIVWGVSRTLLRANKALLAPYASKNKDAVPAHFRDPDDHWIGTNVHLLVILQNTKLLPAEPGPEELGRPDRSEIEGQDRLHGSGEFRLGLFQPHHAGADCGAATTPAGRRSRACSPTRKVLNRSSLVFQGVGNGEFALGMSLEYAGYQWSSNGAPVKVIYPADGTVAQMEGVAIIKGGPNTENAKQFVDYVTRKDVREAILRFAFRRPARQDLDLSKLPGAMPQLADVKLVDYDEDAWVEKRVETAQKIQDIIRRTR